MESSRQQEIRLVDDAVVAILREVALQPDEWQAARTNPRTYLQERHQITLPADLTIDLFDIARDTSESPLYVPELETPAQTTAAYRAANPYVPQSLIEYLRERNMGCPLGTVPYKTVRTYEKCIKKGLIKGGLEWSPAQEGSPLGHWTYTDVHEICLQSITVTEEVIECMYFLVKP